LPAWLLSIVLYLSLSIFLALITKSAALLLLARSHADRQAKNAWILRILLIPFLGGLLYLVWYARGWLRRKGTPNRGA